MGLPTSTARLPLLIIAILVVMFGVMSYRAAREHSPTIDEPLHAVAGYQARFAGDHRMNLEDPPLWKYWAMLPQSRSELISPGPGDFDFSSGGFLIASQQLFQTPGTVGDAFINRSRTAMLLLGLVLLIALAGWGWQVAGPMGAVTSCVLFAFDPNFLGHASLVKNDVAVSMVLFCAAWATWSCGKCVRWWNVILLALLCAMAATVKFSGLLGGPIVVLLLGFRAWTREPWQVLGWSFGHRGPRVLTAAVICIVCFVTAWAGIWACYGFRFSVSAGGDLSQHMDAQVLQLQRNRYFLEHRAYPAPEQIASLPVPLAARVAKHMYGHHCLPEAYIVGGMLTWAASFVRGAYLLGESSMTGWWYYFPLAMLFKTPLSTLAAMLLVAISTVVLRGSPRSDQWARACIVLPLAIYSLFALTTNLNIGLRHILPIYPFIYLLIGIAASRAAVVLPRLFKPLAIALALGLIIESVSAHPHYISYFNIAARPYRLTLLSDSNFDWGQDLTYVARWQMANPDTPLYLGYWGPADPEYYGIRGTILPGGNGRSTGPPDMSRAGVIMVSATMLQGVNQPDAIQDYYAPLRARNPDGMIGDSIYMFKWVPPTSP